MKNLTELSLNHKNLVWYFIIVIFIGGIFSYFRLGRMEDPSFTICEMFVVAYWPGATAEEVQDQVADKFEKKLLDIPYLKYLETETHAGYTKISISIDDTPDNSEIRPLWQKVRNYCEDIQETLPAGVVGPFFYDEYDEVYGSIYAITGDGFSYEELRRAAEMARKILFDTEDVKHAELNGTQEEKIYIEIDREKISALGVSPQVISNTLAKQNIMTPAGNITTDSDDINLRVAGIFQDVDEIKNLPINSDGKIFKLGDIATVTRSYPDPPESKIFFNGKPAVEIILSMNKGGNIIKLGETLDKKVAEIQSELPLGMEIHKVADQPTVVKDSINEFVETLLLAIVIVLAVSFFSLGFRTGLVVAGCIPLVLAGTFCLMYIAGVDLHKVSLGSLIIALGLLVDDAIIAVEMMSVQLERGFSKFDAACHAFNVTAKPMLTGTLITCAGFIPVAFARGIASEFCKDLFFVVSSALLLSWVVSVMVAPLFGTYIIKAEKKSEKEIYQNRFYKIFRRILENFLSHKIFVAIGCAVIIFLTTFVAGFVSEEFFPASTRPEIIVNLELPSGSSIKATEAEAERFSKFLDSISDEFKSYVYYVGCDTPRFVLTVNSTYDSANDANFVVVAKSEEMRDELAEKIRAELDDNFPNVTAKISFIQTGPPSDYPVMLRVSGDDVEKVQEISQNAAKIIAEDSNITYIGYDWNEKSKVVKIDLDQDKLRALGLSSQDIKSMLYTEINGLKISSFYTGDETIDIILRLSEVDRNNIENIKNLPIYLGAAGYVPLSQIANIYFDAEYGLIWRRNLKPTITIQANIASGTSNDATLKAYDDIKEIRENLPFGYTIEPAGDLDNSDNATDNLLAPIPAMIFIVMTLLMIQLQDGRAMILTLMTAPLGIIGVIFALVIFGRPLGFVAELGVIALFGMIIRNTVILIDQIQQHLATGENLHDAIIDSAILRFRPIMLTAIAAILGMLPLMPSIFWGPMAFSIAGGLLVATVLTLLVLPVLYAAVYKESEKHE